MNEAKTDTASNAGGTMGILKAFPRSYWMLNSIEMFERLAYFSMRAMVPIYLMQASDPGGLHLTAAHKGTIYAWWFVLQSLLPMLTGGYADRYGYKKTMGFAVSMNIVGYVLMAFGRDYWSFFIGVMVLATGTAFFKPSIQGSLAQNLSKKIRRWAGAFFTGWSTSAAWSGLFLPWQSWASPTRSSPGATCSWRRRALPR